MSLNTMKTFKHFEGAGVLTPTIQYVTNSPEMFRYFLSNIQLMPVNVFRSLFFFFIHLNLSFSRISHGKSNA